MKKSRGFTVLVVLCIMASIPHPAHAYIDPGTGSMIVQAIIGAVVAISVSLGLFRSRVKKFFRRLIKTGAEPEKEK